MDNYKLRHQDIDLDKPIAEFDVGKMMGSGDDEASKFTVGVFRSGAKVDISACTVKGYLIMPNDETLEIDGTVEDGKAVVVIKKEGYVYDGAFTLTVKLVVGGRGNSIAIFNGRIARTSTDVVSDGEKKVYTALEVLELINDMEQAEADAKAATQAAYDAIAAVNDKVNEAGTAIVNTASGAMVSITDGAARPAVELISHIEPVQAGSGVPSPDNVRAIGGWDAADVTRVGKNLATEVAPVGLGAPTNGIADALYNASYRSLHAEVVEGHAYVIKRTSTSDSLRFRVAFTETAVVNSTVQAFGFKGADNVTRIDVVAPAGAKHMYVYLDNTGKEIDLSKYMIYDQAEAKTLTADLPETVYGGTLDWTTGIMTVTHKKAVISSVDTLHAVGSGYLCASHRFSDKFTGGGINGWCDRCPTAETTSGLTQSAAIFVANNARVYLCFPKTLVGETLESFNAYLAANPVTVVYPISVTYTHQLTSQQLDTLYCMNNVWSTTGDTDLTYVADTKLYIDQKLAAIAAATLNN